MSIVGRYLHGKTLPIFVDKNIDFNELYKGVRMAQATENGQAMLYEQVVDVYMLKSGGLMNGNMTISGTLRVGNILLDTRSITNPYDPSLTNYINLNGFNFYNNGLIELNNNSLDIKIDSDFNYNIEIGSYSIINSDSLNLILDSQSALKFKVNTTEIVQVSSSGLTIANNYNLILSGSAYLDIDNIRISENVISRTSGDLNLNANSLGAINFNHDSTIVCYVSDSGFHINDTFNLYLSSSGSLTIGSNTFSSDGLINTNNQTIKAGLNIYFYIGETLKGTLNSTDLTFASGFNLNLIGSSAQLNVDQIRITNNTITSNTGSLIFDGIIKIGDDSNGSMTYEAGTFTFSQYSNIILSDAGSKIDVGNLRIFGNKISGLSGNGLTFDIDSYIGNGFSFKLSNVSILDLIDTSVTFKNGLTLNLGDYTSTINVSGLTINNYSIDVPNGQIMYFKYNSNNVFSLESDSGLTIGNNKYLKTTGSLSYIAVDSLYMYDYSIKNNENNSYIEINKSSSGFINFVLSGSTVAQINSSGFLLGNLKIDSNNIIMNINNNEQISLKTSGSGDIILNPGSTGSTYIYYNNLSICNFDSTGLIMNNKKITGLTAGSSGSDAIRHDQVFGFFLPSNGGTLTGSLNMNSNSINGLSPVNASGYAVEYNQMISLLNLKANLTGFTMSGFINMNSNYITGLSPVNASGYAVEYNQMISLLNLKANLTGFTMSGFINMNSNYITGLSPVNASGYAVEYNQMISLLNLKANLTGFTMSGFINMNSNSISNVSQLDVDNIRIFDNTIASTSGNIILSPNGANIISVTSNILPSSTNLFSLGAVGNLWSNIYTTSIVSGSLTVSGSSIISNTTNTNITINPNGTGSIVLLPNYNINNTVLIKKTSISHANLDIDSYYQIGTCNMSIRYQSGLSDPVIYLNSYNYGGDRIYTNNDASRRAFQIWSVGAQNLTYRCSNTTHSSGALISTWANMFRMESGVNYSNTLLPFSTGSMDLGSSSYRWRDIHATNGTIQTSGRRLKKDISKLDCDKAYNFVLNLNPCCYKYIVNESNRTHFGLIADEVKQTAIDSGYDPNEFAPYTCSKFIREIKEKRLRPEYEGTNIQNNEEYMMEEVVVAQVEEQVEGLRYGELISFLIAAIKRQQHIINEQNSKITNIEDKLSNIVNSLSTMQSLLTN
jgi:hypothetical protein